jgi:hypothetical protein
MQPESVAHLLIPAPANLFAAPTAQTRLDDAIANRPSIGNIADPLALLIAPQPQAQDPRPDDYIEESFERAINAITDEQLYAVIEIEGPLGIPGAFATSVLQYLQRFLIPGARTENEIRIFLWYEWQARLMQASAPVIRLLPFAERASLLNAILAIIDERRPW